MTIPYVYKMTNQKSNEYYIGCRYTEGCNPEETFDVYATSSRLVKSMIRENPVEWKKDILFTGDFESVQLEEGYLIKANIDNPLCLNGMTINKQRYVRTKVINDLPEVNEDLIAEQIKNLGLKIREARKAQNITCENLAKAIGIGRSTLQRIEQGGAGSEIGSILKTMQLLNIHVSYDGHM